MELTRITKDNQEYFRYFLPPGQAIPDQEALGLISEDGKPCAAALISGIEGEAALDWIFVCPDQRRQGAGSELLQKIEGLLKREADAFSVSYPAGVEGMDDFLQANGFFLTEGNVLCTIPLEQIQASSEAKKLKKMVEKEDIRTLASLNEIERAAFLAFLAEQFEQEDALFRCEPKLSFAAFEGRRVTAALLIERQDELKTLFISALAGRGRMAAISVLGRAFSVLDHEPDLSAYLIQFLSANKKIDNLIDTIGDFVDTMDVDCIRYAVKALNSVSLS